MRQLWEEEAQVKLIPKRCHTCGALGVGPDAVKLWPFEGRFYCKEHYQDPLTWHESRGAVVAGIKSESEFDVAVRAFKRQRGNVLKGAWQEWDPYIRDICGLAEFGLIQQDKKIFVKYFTLAVWAWDLSQAQEAT